MFDSHCHLDFQDFALDRSEILSQCSEAGVKHICIPGVSELSWSNLLSIVSQPNLPVSLYSALGLHPYYQDEHQHCHLDKLSHLLEHEKESIFAIGEIGLDFALPETNQESQLFYFDQQLELAQQFQLPVIIHARKSHDRVLQRLRKVEVARGGIIHAFSGSRQQAEQYIDLGFKLGFGGGVTYERARKTRELASSLPITSIVLETDSPDMPLSGFQGQRNTPLQLPLVAEAIAALRKISVAELISQTTSTSCEILLPKQLD
ncbi:hypothetical protein EOPP23_12270 [Endozoicomonas sp. OPT23]|nr:hypothetical protein [Endozoicomonas sp. OPT23]